MVDVVDAAEVGRHNWHTYRGKRGNLYATSGHRGPSLHRFVSKLAGLDLTQEVDHVNGDGLDCRRANLRAASSAENKRNQRTRKDTQSGIKGVTWEAQRGKWRAQVQADGRRLLVGRFDDIRAAEEAVRSARVRLHGAFANHGVN